MTFVNPPLSGTVFNIQKYSVHDGPGIRTVVFLKGCPLRCMWCSNPESQQPHPQLAYNRNKCLTLDQCLRCAEICAVGAIQRDDDNRVRIDRGLCNDCLLCADACPSKALNVFGETMTVDQVLQRVEQDGAFYTRSGGGLTLSGGEPMFQVRFTLALLAEARNRRINTAMETSGLCDGRDLEAACGHLNYLLYDIKVIDPELHKRVTGVSNRVILDNFRRIRQAFPQLPIRVRTPVVPGVNDNEEQIRRILDFIGQGPNLTYEMLAYHRLGMPKYDYLGAAYPLADDLSLAPDLMDRLQALVRAQYGHLAPKAA